MDSDPDGLNVRVFRGLAITGATAPLLWTALTFLFPGIYSPAASDALEWNGYESLLPPTPVYLWLWLFLHVASSISVCRFSKPGRYVFTALFIANCAIGAASGLQVGTGFDSLFGSIFGLTSGGVLVMAWTPPMRDRFGVASTDPS